MTAQTSEFRLGINTGFAVNRYSEPEVWLSIIGNDLQLKYVQLTADMINPSLGAGIISRQVRRIRKAALEHGVTVTSTFTGAFTRVNHLAHPDADIRQFWVNWFKDFVDITADLGATAMGSHFGIFTHNDNGDPDAREIRRRQNIEGWHTIGAYAKARGLEYISWEPMSISREQGETLGEAWRLQEDVNSGAPIPFQVCLDVDHGDLASPDPDDTDPYAWLAAFAKDAPQVHLKQSSANKGGHWPFTAQHNAEGRIVPTRVLDTLRANGAGDTELIFELSFREREPADSTVVQVLRESVDYWRVAVPD